MVGSERRPRSGHAGRGRIRATALLLLLLMVIPARLTAQAERSVPAVRADLVVLVHGLARTRLSMLPLEWELESRGYEVMNWGYSSTTASVAEIAASLAVSVDSAARAQPGRRIHFVGHSLGNIIVRWVLANGRPRGVGRVVMLAPPNQGSRDADRAYRWLGWLLKPLPELRTDPQSTARSLPAPGGVEFGIIAGAADGKVSVEETYLPGAAGHVVVPAGHTFLMARGDVQDLVVGFLRTGRFPG